MNRLDRIYKSELPHRAVAVYLYLRGRANKEGQCWPSLHTVARDLKLSVRTVQRGIADLKQAGYLGTEQPVPAKRRQRLAAVYDEEMSGWGRQGGSAAMGWPVDMVLVAGQGE